MTAWRGIVDRIEALAGAPFLPLTGGTVTGFTSFTGGALIQKRVDTLTAVTSITPNSSLYDVTYINYTGASGTITINNDTGTPNESQSMLFKFNFTNSQTISWGNIFVGTSLPTTVSGGNAIYWLPMIYDSVYSHWDCSASLTGGFM